MDNRQMIYDAMLGVSEGLQYLDIISERDYRGCLRMPAVLYPVYEPNPNKDYLRGAVVKTDDDNINKFVFTGDGRLNEKPRIVRQDGELRVVPNIVRLVRNINGRYRRVRDEFLESDMIRWWDDDPNRPQAHGWYKVRRRGDGGILIVTDNTPPPNNETAWEFLGNENPPE